MNILYALFLGVLQGATEFLPLSSSGPLAWAEAFLRGPATVAFTLSAACLFIWLAEKKGAENVTISP